MRGFETTISFEPKDSDPKRDQMKRTRRIEITRYRRRVTVRQDEDDAADLSLLGSVAHEWETLPPEAESLVKVISAAEIPTSPRRSFFGLRKWLKEKL